ncbi:uncharacterized protein BCR38DRAFT_431326, partial [Pseudomassariella vexata]
MTTHCTPALPTRTAPTKSNGAPEVPDTASHLIITPVTGSTSAVTKYIGGWWMSVPLRLERGAIRV